MSNGKLLNILNSAGENATREELIEIINELRSAKDKGSQKPLNDRLHEEYHGYDDMSCLYLDGELVYSSKDARDVKLFRAQLLVQSEWAK